MLNIQNIRQIADRKVAERGKDRGATAVEYALIIAGVAAVLAITVFALQGVLTGMFQDTCESVVNANNGGAVPTDACDDANTP